MEVFLRELAWLCISGALLSSNKLYAPLWAKLSNRLPAVVFWPGPSHPCSKPPLETKICNLYQKSLFHPQTRETEGQVLPRQFAKLLPPNCLLTPGMGEELVKGTEGHEKPGLAWWPAKSWRWCFLLLPAVDGGGYPAEVTRSAGEVVYKPWRQQSAGPTCPGPTIKAVDARYSLFV